MMRYFYSILVLLAMVVFPFASQAQQANPHNLVSYGRALGSVNDGLGGYLNPALYPFYHGVASGDPLADRVVIWTRVSPEQAGTVEVAWRVATDPQLTQVVRQGTFVTSQSRDYTVKVDVDGLAPATTYYYGFTALGRHSLTGRTKTAPTSTSHLKFAVVSCSNFQEGYFHVYRELASRNDLDAVVHLGDYIYEYEAGEYANASLNRPHVPAHEMVQLQDYRTRYSLYRLDPDLRAAHQQHPFITIWDDHEFANDAYRDGAENHSPATEGPWNSRKNNAWNAYFEWMPVRESGSSANPFRLYRTIKYGNLVDLIMLDTRIEGRDKQGSGWFARFAQAGRELESLYARKGGEENLRSNEVEAIFRKHLPLMLHVAGQEGGASPSALNPQEFEFLVSTLTQWANDYHAETGKRKPAHEQEGYTQVLKLVKRAMRHQEETLPTGKAQASRKLLGNEQFNWLEQQLAGSNARWKLIGNQILLTPLEGVPLADTWDGYDDERERLLDFLDDRNIQNTVVLTGDIHMTFAGDVPTSTFWYGLGWNNSVAVEFVTPSITSKNLNELLGLSDGFLTWTLEAFNPHIKHSDLVNHGFMLIDVTNDQVQSDWYYVSHIAKPSATLSFNEGWLVRNGEQRLRKAGSPVAHSGGGSAPAPATPPATAVPFAQKPLVLLSAFPNPANTHSQLNYLLTQQQQVLIQIHDQQGRLVSEVLNQQQPAGNYLVQFSTSQLANDIYTVSIATNGYRTARQLIVQH